jgi:leucyl-tRNA synthetase
LFNQGILTAPAYQDETGRRVPADEVTADGERWIHEPTGAEVRQVVSAMSKSLRNVINPDDVIEEQGADAFRLYEMFMAPLGDTRTWDVQGISGCRRFLDRVWKLCVDPESDLPLRPELSRPRTDEARAGANEELERALHVMLERVDDSFEELNFNTAIAAMMTFVNEALKRPGSLDRDQLSRFVRAVAPFAPHIAEELWSRMGHDDSIARASWPQADPAYLVEDRFELVVQVQGKVRARTEAPRSASRDELSELAREAATRWLEGKQIVKTVVVPGRLVNFVVR